MSRASDTLWDAAFEEAADYIESKRKSTDLRGAYYDMMSERNWKTKDFNALVDLVVDNERVIEDEYLRNGVSEERALRDAIADIVDGHFAQVILSDRKLARELPDRTFDTMTEAMNKFADLFQGRSRRGRRDRDRDRDYDDRDERPRRRERDDRDDRSQNYGERRDDRSSRDRDRSGYSRDRGRKSTDENDPWAHLQALEEGFDTPPANARKEDDHDLEERDEPRGRRESIHEPLEGEILTPGRRGNVEGPDFTRADPYGDYWQDDEHWIVAHRAPWSLYNPDTGGIQDVPSLYDMNRFVKYFVKSPDGIVREELQEVTQDNRYLNQDLRQDRGEEEAPRRGGVSLKPRPAGEVFETTPAVGEAPAPRTVNLVEKLRAASVMVPNVVDSRAVDSLSSAAFAARSRMFGDEETVGVTLSHQRTPMNASSWEQLELIDEIINTPNLVAAAEKLNELRPQMDVSIWTTLNERFSTLVLRAMRYQFQYTRVSKFSSGGFARDYKAVIADMVKQRGDEFCSHFGERTRYITKMACCYADREEIKDLIGDLYTGEKEFPCVVFLEFFEIISLDASLEELGITHIAHESCTPSGMSVTSGQQSTLAASLRALYEALNASLPAGTNARVILSTSDNHMVEVTGYSNRIEGFILNLLA